METKEILILAGLGLVGAYAYFNKGLGMEDVVGDGGTPVSYGGGNQFSSKDQSTLSDSTYVFRTNDTTYKVPENDFSTLQKWLIKNNWYRIKDGNMDFTPIPNVKNAVDQVSKATLRRSKLSPNQFLHTELNTQGGTTTYKGTPLQLATQSVLNNITRPFSAVKNLFSQPQDVVNKPKKYLSEYLNTMPTKAEQRKNQFQATSTQVKPTTYTNTFNPVPTKAQARNSNNEARVVNYKTAPLPRTSRQTGVKNGVSYNLPSSARITGSLKAWKK